MVTEYNFQNVDNSGNGNIFPGDEVNSQITGSANGVATYEVAQDTYNGDNTYTVQVRQKKFGNDGEAATLSSTFKANGLDPSTGCNEITKNTPLPYVVCNPDWDIVLV